MELKNIHFKNRYNLVQAVSAGNKANHFTAMDGRQVSFTPGKSIPPYDSNTPYTEPPPHKELYSSGADTGCILYSPGFGG